jgi:hypothetical protein
VVALWSWLFPSIRKLDKLEIHPPDKTDVQGASTNTAEVKE